MAEALTLHFASLSTGIHDTTLRCKPPSIGHRRMLFRRGIFISASTNRRNASPITRAVEESKESVESAAVDTASSGGGSESEVELSELGSEIKKAMEKRKEEGGKDFWSGVAEEVREIEWPALGKVVATTGVVLGVIAGSSVVLLTVNAVLAELSDGVFAGRGVQDFFG